MLPTTPESERKYPDLYHTKAAEETMESIRKVRPTTKQRSRQVTNQKEAETSTKEHPKADHTAPLTKRGTRNQPDPIE